MQRIADLEHQIREHLNFSTEQREHLHAAKDDWNILCVSLDTLGDSAQALMHYEHHGEARDDGEKYLRLYGMLQAIVLQQDAIRNISRVITGAEEKLAPDSGWMQLRDIRIMTSGHPMEKTSKRGTQRIFVSRITIHKAGFQLQILHPNADPEFRDVDLDDLFTRYKNEAVELLEKIHQSQVEKWGPADTA